MKRCFIFPLLLVACTVDQKKLSGTWQAVALFELEQKIDTSLETVQLTLTESGDYTFTSLGLYEEKGFYRVAGSYLFLTDTTVAIRRERALKVHYVSSDSLKIGMMRDGKKRTIFFGKSVE